MQSANRFPIEFVVLGIKNGHQRPVLALRQGALKMEAYLASPTARTRPDHDPLAPAEPVGDHVRSSRSVTVEL